MNKDYYASEIEKKLSHKVKIIDYISLLKDENFIYSLYSTGKQIVIALDEEENFIFVDISFWGKFKLLSCTGECKISMMKNYEKLKIDKCPQLNGVYTVQGKQKCGKYSKDEFINIILSK